MVDNINEYRVLLKKERGLLKAERSFKRRAIKTNRAHQNIYRLENSIKHKINLQTQRSFNQFRAAPGAISATFGLGGGDRGGVRKREVGSKRLLTALGAVPTAGRGYQGAGPGRPRGTFKYGVPIQEYKKLQAQRKLLYSQYAQKQEEALVAKGFAPSEVYRLQRDEVGGVTPYTQNINISSNPVAAPVSAADDEFAFQQFVAQRTVTPNTQRILDDVRRIQLKAQRDDLNQQRVHKERLMVSNATNLMKTRNLFGPDSQKFNILDTQTDNLLILRPGNNILETRQDSIRLLAPTGRPTVLQTVDNIMLPKQNKIDILGNNRYSNILNTAESGNNLSFF